MKHFEDVFLGEGMFLDDRERVCWVLDERYVINRNFDENSESSDFIVCGAEDMFALLLAADVASFALDLACRDSIVCAAFDMRAGKHVLSAY